MDLHKLLICVMPVLLLLQETATDCPEVASSVGQEFMFGVPSKDIGRSEYIFVHITPVSYSPAHVRVTSPFNNFDKQFTFENEFYVRLMDNLVQVESGLQFKGIEVSSDVNISVAVLAYNGYWNTEGFLVLPVTALSTRYVAASYQPAMNKNNSVLVVGVESNTDVSITYTKKGQKASLQNFTLQKFETFQLQDSYDLSGTVVISNKPVAVISGSYQSRIPVGVGLENYLVEQMIPTKYWTNRFIVPPIYPDNSYIVKILVDKNNTEIHYFNSTSHFAVYLDQGSVYEAMFGSEPTVIQANNPISVFQYYSNSINGNGIPYMTTVQGISQFVSSYRFYANYIFYNKTIALTLQRNTINGLQLNGRNISFWNAVIVPIVKPMNNYVTIFINISQGVTYDLHHSNGEVFGLSIYQLYQNLSAYGYPLRLSLSTAECDAARPTTTLETSTPNGPATTDINRNGTWCMECDNMSHLKYCDTVARCGTDNEVCYVQAYARSERILVYRSGCIDRNKCLNHERNVHCQTCCDGNFCNTAGCGDPGLQDLHKRGPLCFDCTHTGDEDICRALQMCAPGQVCKVEKYTWGSGFHYSMGCVEKAECSSKRSFHDFQSRNVIACSQCCDSDFCNQNCTTPHNPAIIG